MGVSVPKGCAIFTRSHQGLERCKEIKLSKNTKDLLSKISSASIDRCLHPIRINSSHDINTIKPGSLLKKA